MTLAKRRSQFLSSVPSWAFAPSPDKRDYRNVGIRSTRLKVAFRKSYF
jgi:hypothetical protein